MFQQYLPFYTSIHLPHPPPIQPYTHTLPLYTHTYPHTPIYLPFTHTLPLTPLPVINNKAGSQAGISSGVIFYTTHLY